MKIPREIRTDVRLNIKAVDVRDGSLEGIIRIGASKSYGGRETNYFFQTESTGDIFVKFTYNRQNKKVKLSQNPFYYGEKNEFYRDKDSLKKFETAQTTQYRVDIGDVTRKFYRIPLEDLGLKKPDELLLKKALDYVKKQMPKLIAELEMLEVPKGRGSGGFNNTFYNFPPELKEEILKNGYYYSATHRKVFTKTDAVQGPQIIRVPFGGMTQGAKEYARRHRRI